MTTNPAVGLAAEPLEGQRFELWWKLIGAYTGEVPGRVHGGQWRTSQQAPGAASR
ncbi:hypothetical protein [Amycolatopsis sp. lyj-23]|uniref:hypothetical protein n=1 Tax=Amycolatopsis sp. lyj-23 TaxID=2789283 RepID=UPI00397B4DF1